MPAALQVFAGPLARQHLLECGLAPADVRVVPAAAGGPKGLVLNALDRFLFGTWLAGSPQVVHLAGASIGAWRMACACMDDPDAAFRQLAHDYIHERYDRVQGKAPSPRQVSASFERCLAVQFGGREARLLAHPTRRLHVFVSRGRHVLRRAGPVRTPLGYFGAFAANLLSRRAMGGWVERVVFQDPRDALPLPLNDYRSRVLPLTEANLQRSILASCSIPFWLEAVQDIPGAPKGSYWDGGITDYHLHLDYARLAGGGLVLYPHFQSAIVPGWLDKALKRRHRATPGLANVIVLAPDPEWVATLPGAKLPDRQDFKTYQHDDDARMRAWQRATAEAQRLADEFAALVNRSSIEALPLQ